MHWGHAVSVDLFNWVHLPIFLLPDPSVGIDNEGKGGIFSGSAIPLPIGMLRIFYTDAFTGRKPMEFQKSVVTLDGIHPAERAQTSLQIIFGKNEWILICSYSWRTIGVESDSGFSGSKWSLIFGIINFKNIFQLSLDRMGNGKWFWAVETRMEALFCFMAPMTLKQWPVGVSWVCFSMIAEMECPLWNALVQR